MSKDGKKKSWGFASQEAGVEHFCVDILFLTLKESRKREVAGKEGVSQRQCKPFSFAFPTISSTGTQFGKTGLVGDTLQRMQWLQPMCPYLQDTL